MRYWLLRRPPLYSDIHPNSANTPRDYDKIFVNVRLKAGDIVYLIAAYDELYGWGQVDKRESYQDSDLQRRAYRVTVTRLVVQQDLLSADEIERVPDLAGLFSNSDLNLVELKPAQASSFNRLLRSKGVVSPPDKEEAEEEIKPKPYGDFPRVLLAPEVRVWLDAAYAELNAGRKFKPDEMVVRLWGKIPEDFEYKSIDRRLMNFGAELTLLGVLHVDPSTAFASEADQVIRFVRELIVKEPAIQSVSAEQVSEGITLQEERVAVIFGFIHDLGDFWNGANGHGDMPGYYSITIRDEHVKREYLSYKGLEPLLERFHNAGGQTQESAQATSEEQPSFVHSLLDWKLNERLDAALDHINGLRPEGVLECDTECFTTIVGRFLIAPPIVRSKLLAADERIVEGVDETFDRKTGTTFRCFLIPVEGEPKWLEEIDSQKSADGYPLAFLDKKRGWIDIRLMISPDDPEGSLKGKLDQRVSLVEQYSNFVKARLDEFNKELAEEMTKELNKRKGAILKAEKELESLGLPRIYNPKHAETAIQIERLMQSLDARLISTPSYANQLYEDVKVLAGNEPLDRERAKLLIEKADDAIKEFGSTDQEKKVELRKWKAQAELVLPPGTIEELRKRGEGLLLRKSYPRSAMWRNTLLVAAGLLVVILGLLAMRQAFSGHKDLASGTQSQPRTASPVPSVSPSPATTPSKIVASKDAQEDSAKSQAQVPRSCINREQSNTFFEGDITVAVGPVDLEGSPLRRFVSVTVSSPGYDSAKYPHQENGDKIIYRGRGVFEITLISTDTDSACFEVRRIDQGKSRGTPRIRRSK